MSDDCVFAEVVAVPLSNLIKVLGVGGLESVMEARIGVRLVGEVSVFVFDLRGYLLVSGEKSP